MDKIENMDLASVLAVFEKSTLSEMELSCSSYTIKLKRPVAGEVVAVAPIAAQAPRKAEAAIEAAPVAAAEGEVITSPIVGTFYLTPAPDAPPYVKVGSKVATGDVICTIEAMKLMNQLEAEFACEILEILVKPETLIEFGQPLFKVKRV